VRPEFLSQVNEFWNVQIKEGLVLEIIGIDLVENFREVGFVFFEFFDERFSKVFHGFRVIALNHYDHPIEVLKLCPVLFILLEIIQVLRKQVASTGIEFQMIHGNPNAEHGQAKGNQNDGNRMVIRQFCKS